MIEEDNKYLKKIQEDMSFDHINNYSIEERIERIENVLEIKAREINENL